jgi:hypothetical protein
MLVWIEKLRDAKARKENDGEISREIFEDIECLIESAEIVGSVSVEDFRTGVSDIKNKYI